MVREPPENPEQAVREYCETFLAVRRKMARPEGFHYHGMEDFLLRHAKFYEPTEWTGKFGAPKCCFGNALVMCAIKGYGYVEGVAMTSFGFITHHGWNVDEQGRAVDTTWRDGGLAYFGVEFAPGRGSEAAIKGDANVLSDWKRRFPIYRKPWTGEKFEQWPRVDLAELIEQAME